MTVTLQVGPAVIKPYQIKRGQVCKLVSRLLLDFMIFGHRHAPLLSLPLGFVLSLPCLSGLNLMLLA